MPSDADTLYLAVRQTSLASADTLALAWSLGAVEQEQRAKKALLISSAAETLLFDSFLSTAPGLR